jgi:hypothetical protein
VVPDSLRKALLEYFFNLSLENFGFSFSYLISHTPFALLKQKWVLVCRGENAFCSPECRDKHIRIEDFKEKSGSEARKKQECSVTPCSSPLLFFAGVAAA